MNKVIISEKDLSAKLKDMDFMERASTVLLQLADKFHDDTEILAFSILFNSLILEIARENRIEIR